MKESDALRQRIITMGGYAHAAYTLDFDETMNWLHDGVSHALSAVFVATYGGPFKPLVTRCGEKTADRLDEKSIPFLHVVPVPTTCVWCMAGKLRDTK